MIFYSSSAREQARAEIADINKKIACIPLNVFPEGLKDVQTIHFLLEQLDGELRREIKEDEKKQREREQF